MNSKRNLFLFLASLTLISISWTQVQAQCGVYLKPVGTQSIPYARVYFDRADDLTGDGLPDILASESPTSSSFARTRTFVIPNLGNGRFGTPSVFIQPPAANPTYSNYQVIKFNNDANKDVILWYGNLSEQFIIGINNGNGTFTYGPLTSSAQFGQNRSFWDVDGDGLNDWIGRLDSPFRIVYSAGNGDGTFDPPVQIFDHFANYEGDFNGDGKIDFVDSNHLHLNQGSATFGSIDITDPVGTQTVWGRGDFNADGKSDFLVASGNFSTSFATVTSTGAGFTRTNFNVTSGVGTPSAVNIGGNAATDVVFNPRDLSETVYFINDGTGNFTARTTKGKWAPRTEQTVIAADFDNDGYYDQVRGTSYTANSKIMLTDVTSFTYMKNVQCTAPGQTRIVDYDYSQTTDWSFWNPATGDWTHRINAYNGGLSVTDAFNWGLGSLGDIPTPGDFDGDGSTDRAVFRNSTGVWYIRRSSDLAWYVLPFGSTGDQPVVGDFDGDTKTDIAVWRPSDGNWYIWYMGPQTYSIVHFGLNGDMPAPADYDGDQKIDIAVYRPSTGVWYLLKSSNNEFVAFQWGIDTDKPLPADYDGDGKADITVFRPSNQFAYIYRSGNGGVNYYQVGQPGDVPQIGDYDGDFVADIGFYRPSTRLWGSSANILTTNLGSDNAIPTASTLKSY